MRSVPHAVVGGPNKLRSQSLIPSPQSSRPTRYRVVVLTSFHLKSRNGNPGALGCRFGNTGRISGRGAGRLRGERNGSANYRCNLYDFISAFGFCEHCQLTFSGALLS